VFIVYGTKDEHRGPSVASKLSNMPHSEVFAMEGAGHASYMNKPDEWHRLIYNFVSVLRLEQTVD